MSQKALRGNGVSGIARGVIAEILFTLALGALGTIICLIIAEIAK